VEYIQKETGREQRVTGLCPEPTVVTARRLTVSGYDATSGPSTAMAALGCREFWTSTWLSGGFGSI
jgi:hypothetical protein